MSDIQSPASSAPAQADTSVPEESSADVAEGQEAVGAEAENLEAVQNDPTATKAEKKEAARRLKALRLKIDGREVEEQLPFEIPDTPEAVEYMKRQLQMSKAAQKRMGEKAALEQEVSRFLQELRSNPRKVLQDPSFGVDVKKLAAEIIEEEIANSQKSPEQLEREKLERELMELREQRKKEQEDYQKREFERLQQMEYERYDNLMTQALETSDLPKSPYVVKKMADYMMMGLSEGIDVTPQDVLPLVREEILEDIREMAQAMPIETLEKLFGGDVLSKIRKKNVAKAKSAQAIPPKKAGDVGATKASPTSQEPKKMSYKEFFKV